MNLKILSGISFIIFCISVNSTSGHVLDTVPFIDGHNDLAYNLYKLNENKLQHFHFLTNLSESWFWGENCKTCFTDYPRLKAGKVGAQFWVAYVSCLVQYKDAVAKTLEQIDVIKRLVEYYPDELAYVTTAAGIWEAFEEKKIASLIGVEGGHSMDSRLGVLRMYYELGVRYMTLTHSCNTPWSVNSNVDDDQPIHNLTAYGQLVIKEMNRLGMIVDLSHVSHAVQNKAIEVSKAPIIFSHSCAYAIHAHHRNVRDDTLLLVKENNGIVMVNFYSNFISIAPELATIDHVVAHINYIVDIAGIDHVGIGADYDGVSLMPVGLEDVSKYPDLFDKLEKENPTRWTELNMQKLAFLNFERVFKAVEQFKTKEIITFTISYQDIIFPQYFAVKFDLRFEMPEESLIPFDDLDAIDDATLWKCRTLLNNSSPAEKDGGRGGGTTTHVISLITLIITLALAVVQF